MNSADLLIGALIVAIVASALLVMIKEKRSGRKCCGCKSCCSEPRIVEVTDGPDNKE